jgi:hypothetical protein
MRNVNWTQVLVFGLVVLVVLALGLGVLWLIFGGWGTMGMMGPGGMRGGWCPWCGGRGVGLGGILAAVAAFGLICLLPLGLLVALALGAGWLARNTGEDRGVRRDTQAACPDCGRPVEDDWTTCPYCGEDLGDV